MLSGMEYVRQSLELHLFEARLMKEHAYFLQLGFMPRDKDFSEKAESLKKGFEGILMDAMSLSNGIIGPEFLQSGEVFTPYTLRAEEATIYLTGVPFNTSITQIENGLIGTHGDRDEDTRIIRMVFMLNMKTMELLEEIIEFKARILSEVLNCKMATFNYPLLIEHILREAESYLNTVHMLQEKEEVDTEQEIIDKEHFWNNIMAEHSKFIRGLLDPTEVKLFEMANHFGNEFDELTKEALEAMEKGTPFSGITEASLAATTELRDFKVQAVQGILNCNIRSLINPLLADHVLREANHFIRLFNKYSR